MCSYIPGPELLTRVTNTAPIGRCQGPPPTQPAISNPTNLDRYSISWSSQNYAINQGFYPGKVRTPEGKATQRPLWAPWQSGGYWATHTQKIGWCLCEEVRIKRLRICPRSIRGAIHGDRQSDLVSWYEDVYEAGGTNCHPTSQLDTRTLLLLHKYHCSDYNSFTIISLLPISQLSPCPCLFLSPAYYIYYIIIIKYSI